MLDKKIVTTIVASIGGSLCCITPIVAVLAGSSSMAASFAWIEPYRPYFIGITILVLLYAWWDKLKPAKNGIDCACEPDENGKVSFFHTKAFLSLITVFATVMLTFPYWGQVLLPSSPKKEVVMVSSNDIVKTTIYIDNMTCNTCEATVEKTALNIDGVLSIKASTPNANAIVKFDKSKTNLEAIMDAISDTGYFARDEE